MTYNKLAKIIEQMTPEQRRMKAIINVDTDRMEYPIMYFELDKPFTNQIQMRISEDDNTLDNDNEGKVYLKVNHPILQLL